MRRSVQPAILLLALSAASCAPGPDPAPPPAPPAPPALATVDLDVGLSAEQRLRWRSATEGSDLVPVDFLRALVDVDTGLTFDRSLERYGFLPSAAGPDNPYGLPIGWTTDVPSYSLLGLDYVGVNCSACHTAQVEAVRGDGSRIGLRIDGAPNLADIEAVALAAERSVTHMLDHPEEALLFVWRLLTLEPPPGTEGRSLAAGLPPEESAALRRLLEPYAEAAKNDVREAEDLGAEILGRQCARVLRGLDEPVAAAVDEVARSLDEVSGERDELTELFDFVARYRALLSHTLETGKVVIAALKDPATPAPGPGRDDPWGIIRNAVFLTETPLTAPTSIPHLFWADEFVWYHADGNTNSVLQRNVAQALALGAYVDEATDVLSLRPRNIFELEDLMGELRAPAWPADHLGPIDPEKAARGGAIFRDRCASCHHAREGTLFALDEIGTDRERAESFLRPQGGVPFWEALPAKVLPLQDFAFRKAGVTPAEVAAHEVPNPTWRGTGKYQARRLDGVWSTAPYLHNGSVPTLDDLLLPAARRPTRFQLGDRAYDAAKVGYVVETAAPIFVFDTSSTGGSNAGHEYGTDLGDEDRRALVEYLKTQ